MGTREYSDGVRTVLQLGAKIWEGPLQGVWWQAAYWKMCMVPGIKDKVKVKMWKDRHAQQSAKHGMKVDGALPPVPVG